jgi:hypothetical protein
MFFHISKLPQANFPYNYQTENFVISLDEGWTTTKDRHGNKIWYKGYLDDLNLSEHVLTIAEEEEPQYSGNFCLIKVFDQGLVIRTDKLRSFPLWYAVDCLTNLQPKEETVWTDSFVMLKNDMTLIHSKFDAIGAINDSTLSLTQVIDQVDAILDTKVKTFLNNLQLPLRVFLSGGIDTALLFSYVQKHTENYELVLNSHCDFDYFYLKNHSTLSSFWGYNQIHHWHEDCVLVSGAPGDEFTVRSPTTANMLLLHYGTSIAELLDDPKYADCLHYLYFNKQKNLDLWAEQKRTYVDRSFADVIKTCCDYNVNDWQHWHIGKTITWTPLRDLGIFKLLARLELPALKDQVMNSVIQRELIKRNNPTILNYLSTQKNSKNYMENLTSLLN